LDGGTRTEVSAAIGSFGERSEMDPVVGGGITALWSVAPASGATNGEVAGTK